MRYWRLVAGGRNQCGIGCVPSSTRWMTGRSKSCCLRVTSRALNYVRNHWDELTRYLDDADLLQDNNLCEQLMATSPLDERTGFTT